MTAPIFVRDLCIALAHKVEPERLFVILTSYMDESGTHAGSPVTVMAAVLGNIGQWSRFQCKLDRLKKTYGFKTFHTKKFKAKAGDFSGWPDDKCLSLIAELSYLTGQSLMHGSVFSISEELYLKLQADMPPKVRVDSRYGLCFRICLLNQIVEIDRRLSHHKKYGETRLNIVLESGHKNAGDVVRIFEEEREALGRAGHLLAGVTFAKKDECDPLMVSDFLAHSAYLSGTGFIDKPDTINPGIKEKTGLTHLAFDLAGIERVKAAMIAKHESRRAWGAAKQSQPQ